MNIEARSAEVHFAAGFVSAFFMWRVEHNVPGATITTFRYAIWWAIETTTRVGYGDYTPVTPPPGRIIATAVMVVGVGLIGTVSASRGRLVRQATQRARHRARRRHVGGR